MFTTKIVGALVVCGALVGSPAAHPTAAAVTEVGCAGPAYGSGLSGDTLGTLNMVNRALCSAGTIARPEGHSRQEVDQAYRDARNMGRNADRMRGYLEEQRVRQEVGRHEAMVRDENAARQNATDTWLDSRRAVDAAEAAGEAFRRGDLAAVPAAIPDAMVETYCAAGPLDKVRARVEATAERADGLFLTPPTYFISPEELSEYQNRIIDAFGPASSAG
jgi:hypothetical protein